MSGSKYIVKSVFMLIIFSLISKLFGFIRELLIAAKFGAGIETDAFFIALTAISLFTTFITQAINTTMVPILSEIEIIEGGESKEIHTNNLLSFVFIISIFIFALSWMTTPLIIKVLARGFEGEKFRLAVIMTRIGLPAIFFSGIIGVFRGYLQSKLMFKESALSQLPFNFIYIIYLLFFSKHFGIKGLMFANLLAISSQILIQLPGIKKAGYKYRFVIDMSDKYVKKILFLIPSVLVSVAINDLNKIVDKSLASSLSGGSISALSYAIRLNNLILGIFISAVATVVFPLFSKETNNSDHSNLKKSITRGINTITLITIPATVLIIIFSKQIVMIAFERGAFDHKATSMTTGALIFYSLGLVSMSLKLLLDKVYYSFKDTKTPMFNGFISIGINIIMNLILINFMGHKGLAFATSISATISTLYLIVKLKYKIVSFEIKEIFKCFLKSLFSSIFMGIIVYYLYNFFDYYIIKNNIYEFIFLIFILFFGFIIYFIIIYFLKVEEFNWIVNFLKKYKNII